MKTSKINSVTVNVTYNKTRRQKLIAGLEDYLNDPENYKKYIEDIGYGIALEMSERMYDYLVYFEDKNGNTISTKYTPSLIYENDKCIILPVSLNDKKLCKAMVEELKARFDTHRLVMIAKMEQDEFIPAPYDPHTDQDF